MTTTPSTIEVPTADLRLFVDMMEMVWKAVPWGKTTVDVGLLNDGELARERIKRLMAKAGA